MDYSHLRLNGITNKEQFLLFQDWFLILSKDDIEITGTSGGESWKLSTTIANVIEIFHSPEDKVINIKSHKTISQKVNKFAGEALERIRTKKTLPGSWWSIHFSSQSKVIDQHSLLHLMRNLGSYKRGPDKLRLGRSALIEAKHEMDDKPCCFPELHLEVSLITQGAPNGPFSKMVAERMIPIIGAILSTCYGTPVTPDFQFFPVKDEKITEVQNNVLSNEIPELALKNIPVWSLIDYWSTSGADEFTNRLIGAMMAYETGMNQKTDHSSLLFFVSAIEALTVPNLEAAKKQRLSKRFCYFLDEFAQEAMDEAMLHGNFEQAFGKISTRKKLAAELYNLRSQPVHTGHFGNYSTMIMANDQAMKVGIVNDIVIGAIEALMKKPVSLLWGHPSLDPSVTIRLEPADNQKLKRKAKNHHKTIDKYLTSLALKDIN